MFFLKKIAVNNMTGTLKVEDGIKASTMKDDRNRIATADKFWGSLLLNSGAYPKKDTKEEINICYADSYMIDDESSSDGFIDLCLFRNDDKFTKESCEVVNPEKIYGYIIFIPSSCDPIKSNGDILFKRFSDAHQLVVVLKENGQYIELDGFNITYENGKLSAKYFI